MLKLEVEKKLNEIHHSLGHEDELKMDEDFRPQGYDSLDSVEFVMSVEKEFGMTVDDHIMVQIKKPSDVVELIITAGGE
jgi:acyl carrier protein